MSYQAHPGYLWQITEEKILKLQLDSFMSFQKFLMEHNMDLDEAAMCFNGEEFDGDFLELEEDETNTLQELYDKFCEDFKAKTGIDIWLLDSRSMYDSTRSRSHWNQLGGSKTLCGLRVTIK